MVEVDEQIRDVELMLGNDEIEIAWQEILNGR